jgi:hypothetical protein
MSGDFDPDQLIKEIDEKFRYMAPRPVPVYSFQPEDGKKRAYLY